MTDDDFVTKIIKKQENTRTDIHALKNEISQLRTDLAANTKLLQQTISFQEAQDEREARQVDIAKDVARIAHAITALVEGMSVQIQELTAHLRELRMSTSVDASMNRLVNKLDGLGLVLDEHATDKESE